MEHGVTCKDCGLQMCRSLPDKWPRGVWINNVRWEVNDRRISRYTLLVAVAAWNKRPKPKKE